MTVKKYTIKDMALIGVMAALVFAATNIRIPIPTMLDKTMLHLGNVCCLLSGLLLGPIFGGFAAGIGSAFFDLTNPMYISDVPFTFTFKFLMAFVCGKISGLGGARGSILRLNILSAFLGAVTYLILYITKNFIYDYFFLRAALQTALIDVGQKAIVSGTNGIIAAVASVPLATAVKKGLERTGFKKTLI